MSAKVTVCTPACPGHRKKSCLPGRCSCALCASFFCSTKIPQNLQSESRATKSPLPAPKVAKGIQQEPPIPVGDSLTACTHHNRNNERKATTKTTTGMYRQGVVRYNRTPTNKQRNTGGTTNTYNNQQHDKPSRRNSDVRRELEPKQKPKPHPARSTAASYPPNRVIAFTRSRLPSLFISIMRGIHTTGSPRSPCQKTIV